ncbi:MAG TPA: septal ring lytic transglycosylase RlpA family protein [Solirubrobacteraceae bacterium]|nr:septal ring lytic transglycosylase RlpA family protein [Solirubrobacteraceae bacterium]
MDFKSMLRARSVHFGAGVAMLAIPTCAVALTAGNADAQSAIQATVSPHRAPFGHAVKVTGGVLSVAAGERLTLQFASAGTGAWRSLGTTVAASRGSYRFATRAQRSGLLRVVGPATTSSTGGAVARASAAGASAVQSLTVGARFNVTRRTMAVTGGRRAHVSGRLLTGLPGRRVVLAARSGHSWHPVAAARTNARGGFMLAVGAGGGSRRALRVQFAGDRVNSPASAPAGSISAAAPDVASWYDDSGATACGFHAYLGVANRTLPCGTHGTFTVGGRSVQATVDDRGPFVGGRNWDLNQNTAAALGFGGVGTVWVSY